MTPRSQPPLPPPAGPARVAVLLAGGGACFERAAQLAHELALPLIDAPSPDFDLLLAWTGRRLELRDNRNPRVGAVCIDLAAAGRRRLSARDPLARAMGKETRSVVDATLGLGADAAMLAHRGYNVLGIERHPVVAAMMLDALMRAGNEPFRFLAGNAIDVLQTLEPRPDVIFLDPMFPPRRRRSAAASKELKLLRMLAGEDADALALFEAARRTALARVVVKRPDHAAPLAPNPTVSYGGKLVRYDVYRLPPKKPA